MKPLYKDEKLELGVITKSKICMSEKGFPIRYKIVVENILSTKTTTCIIRGVINGKEDIIPFRTKVNKIIDTMYNFENQEFKCKWYCRDKDRDRLRTTNKLLYLNDGEIFTTTEGEVKEDDLYIADGPFIEGVLYGLHSILCELNNQNNI